MGTDNQFCHALGLYGRADLAYHSVAWLPSEAIAELDRSDQPLPIERYQLIAGRAMAESLQQLFLYSSSKPEFFFPTYRQVTGEGYAIYCR